MAEFNELKEIEESLSVTDQITLGEWRLREDIAKKIIRVFFFVNGIAVSLLTLMWIVDAIQIAYRLMQPSDRLVTEAVLMTVIGATTVQLGAISFSVAAWLFPKRK